MKSLFLGSALALAACVAPQPQPQPDPQLQPDPAPDRNEPASAVSNMWSYCVTAGPARCIVVPLHDGASTECLNECRAAGFANPRCVYVSDLNWPCSDL